MGQAEIVVVGLLVAVVGLSALARRLSLPYPIVLVLGGALLSAMTSGIGVGSSPSPSPSPVGVSAAGTP